MEHTKSQKHLIFTYESGYRCDLDGNIISPNGKIRKLWVDKKGDGYYNFTVRVGSRLGGDSIIANIPVHRLQAYQKFGNKLFDTGVHVRHLNSNSKDNSWDNITIGNVSENMMDKSRNVRMKTALNASSKIRKFSDEQMVEIRLFHTEHKSYVKTQEKFNINSKGTLHRILNTEYKTIKSNEYT